MRKKRLISWLLVFVMLFSVAPNMALAAPGDGKTNTLLVDLDTTTVDEDQRPVDYQFNISLMTQDGPLSCLDTGATFKTPEGTDLRTILNEFELLDVNGETPEDATIMGEDGNSITLGDDFLSRKMEAGQTDITVWYTGCDGHELTLGTVTGGMATLKIEDTDANGNTVLKTLPFMDGEDEVRSWTLKQGQTVSVDAFEADETHEGKPVMTIDGVEVGDVYTAGHSDVFIDIVFTEKPVVVEDPALTLTVTDECAVTVMANGKLVESGDRIPAGATVTVSEFRTSAEYKYNVKDVTLQYGDNGAETLTGDSYTFVMPKESTNLTVRFGLKSVPAGSVYYIASSDNGGKTENTGAQNSPILSITEAINKAKAAGQTNIEIIFLSDIRETDVRALNPVTLGSIDSLIINGNGNQLIYNGQHSVGESEGFLDVWGNAHVTLRDITVTRTNNEFETRLIHAKGTGTVVDLQNVTLTGGRVGAESSNGGSAIWVEQGAVVNMDGYSKVMNNETVSTGHNFDEALAGAVLVGTYDMPGYNPGVLNITGAEISGNKSGGSTGVGIYVMPCGELNVYADTNRINISDEIYLDVDSRSTVGAVESKSSNLNLARVYLAGNAEDKLKEATFDIKGETDKAVIGIECADTNHYAYRLISRQNGDYVIDASRFDKDSTMDEDGWTDLDGKWDIRYMNYYDIDSKMFVPGLYFIYHTAAIQFHDTRTVDIINGKPITGWRESATTPDAADIAYYRNNNGSPVSEAPNAVITPADTTGSLNGATGLKGEEYLYIPGIVPVGAGYTNEYGDYVVTFEVGEDYKLPPTMTDKAVRVTVGEVTGNGVEQFSSQQYKYEIIDGKGVITIFADTLASLDSDALLDVKLSAEKYYDLTVQMNGPLYKLTRIEANGETTVEQHRLVVSVLEHQGNDLVKVSVGYDLDSNGTVDVARGGVKVTLYAEGTSFGEIDSSRILGTVETDANGIAEFKIGDSTYLPGEGLNNSMTFFAVPYYEDVYRVVSSDTLTLDVETMRGHRLRMLQDGAVEYIPSEITAATSNWKNDGDAATVTLTETRADTRVICYSDLAQSVIFFDRNAPENCTTANSQHCSWIFQSVTGGEPTVLASTDAPSDVRAKAMERSAVTYGNLPVMKMTGYQFKGWSVDKDATEPDVFSDTAFDYLTSAKTLYAVWAPSQVNYRTGHWIEYVNRTVSDPGSQTSGQAMGRNPGFDAETSPVLAVKDSVEREYVNMAAAAADGAEISYYRTVEIVYDDTADITLTKADILSAEDFARIGADEGYDWWTLDGFTAKPQEDVKVLADGTAVFMTKYDRNVYTIRYYPEPGILDDEFHTTIHKFGDIVFSMAAARRDGYDFAQWITKEADSGRPVTQTDIYVWARDIDVYATWTPHSDTTYTVKIMIEDLRTDGIDATEKGWFHAWQIHELNSWSNDSGADARKSIVDPAAAIGAGWNPDGFTYVGYLEDGDMALEQFGHPGNAIKSNGNDTFTVEHLNGNSTTVIYLYFVRNEASVTFMDGVLTEDGTVLPNPAPNVPAWENVTVTDVPYHGTFGEFFPETNPTRAGYDFDGWQDKNGKRVNPEDKTEEFCDEFLKHNSGEFTLYPIWKVRTGGGNDGYASYYLTYMTGIDGRLDVSGIKLDNIADLIANAAQPGGWVMNLPLTYDQPIGYMPLAVRTGYDFTGWYLDADCMKPLVYSSETFRVAGDSTTPVMTEDGWVNLIADISNVFIKNDNNDPEQLRPVYAGYEAHQHTLVLDAAGGTFGTLPEGWSFVPGTDHQKVQKIVTYGEPIGEMPTINRDGYSFTMWQLVDGTATSQIDGNTVWTSTMTNHATLTATAKWVQNPYTYTLNLNDVDAGNGSTKAFMSDDSVVNVEIYYDTKYVDALSHVTAYRNGYTFLGWSLNQYNCENLLGTNTGLDIITKDTVNKLAGESTLYAVWMPNVYEMRVYLNGGSVDKVNGNDDHVQNMVFNQNAYASRYYGDKPGSFQAIYADSGVALAPLYATKQAGYISVPVVFDTVYGAFPEATRDGGANDNYVFGGYQVSAPAWRTMSNGQSVKVIDGAVVTAFDQNTLALTQGRFTDHRDDYVRLDALWSAVFKFDAEHYGEPEPGVSSSKTNLCLLENGEPNNDEHVLTLDGSTTLTKAVVKTDMTSLPDARKEGFTFLGWFDNDGNKYTLEDLQNKDTTVKLYAHFTPTVTFMANFDGVGQNGAGYVQIGGQKYGVWEIGLSELLARYRNLPNGSIDDGRMFLGWHDKDNKVDVSKLANLTGLREPITLIPDFDYVAAFHLPAGAAWPTGTSETKIIRLSNMTAELYNSAAMRPGQTGSTFTNWVSMAYPYDIVTLDTLLQRENGQFTRSYSLIASFMTGGEDADAKKMSIDVTDYTGAKMNIVEAVDSKLAAVSGEALSFTVSCDEVCVVALLRNGELTELTATAVNGSYQFTIDKAAKGDQVVVALLGDINLNGEANSEDLALFARYTFNEYEFDMTPAGIQEMVADVNHNGEANSEDLALFARYTFNEYDFGWNQ